MTGRVQDDRELTTTSGIIAVANLNAQIDALSGRADRARSWRHAGPPSMAQALLVDLLLLRGQVLGRIADYERAAETAEALVREAPDDATAWLARARTWAIFHRFPAASDDLDAAVRRGAGRAALDPERAAILQAAGCHAGALVLCRAAAEHRPDFTTLSALAVLQAERGEVAEAEGLFTEAQRHYREVSPFPVAELDFRRGLMWLGERELPEARVSFGAAVRRVPAYAPALAHLAEAEAAQGAHESAINRLRPLTESSDDPEYTATLALVLDEVGQPVAAEHWRTIAAARYDDLALRHPEAFADHAADFWLSVGGDPQTALVASRTDRGRGSPGDAGDVGDASDRMVNEEVRRARWLTPPMEGPAR